MRKTPEQCSTMAELRIEIDRMDDQLISLRAKRCQYVDRATVLKVKERLPPKTVDRIAELLDSVRLRASLTGLDETLASQIWSVLIEWGVAYEADRLQNGGASFTRAGTISSAPG